MSFFKFLAAGATGPFSGYHWPQPVDGTPGRWAVANEPLEPCRRGLHLCRPDDLPLWLNEELYAVEVAGPVVEADSFVLAKQARLLHHVVAWSPDAAGRFSAACAWEVRDLVAAALRREGKEAGADRLASSDSLSTLLEAAESLSHGSGPSLAGYVADAARFAIRVGAGSSWAASTATTAMVATTTARAAAGPDERESARERELRRQTDWLLHEVVASARR